MYLGDGDRVGELAAEKSERRGSVKRGANDDAYKDFDGQDHESSDPGRGAERFEELRTVGKMVITRGRFKKRETAQKTREEKAKRPTEGS